MRTYAWFVIGLIITHESLLVIGKTSNLTDVLSHFVMSPIFFLRVSLLLFIGLIIGSIALSNCVLSVLQNEWRTHQRVIYGMIYLVTLISGWLWLLNTLLWGGCLIIFLTVLFLLLILNDFGNDVY